MTQISLNKTVFDKDEFEKVVDNKFRQLIRTQALDDDISIDDFFQLYDELFFQIPREGEINSHRYILNREAEYLGVTISETSDIQALLNEITILRQDLLNANKTLLDLNIR
jgi:hypothetical protein